MRQQRKWRPREEPPLLCDCPGWATDSPIAPSPGGVPGLQTGGVRPPCGAVVAGRFLFRCTFRADNISGWGFGDCFRLPLGHVTNRLSRGRAGTVEDDRPLMQIGQRGATRGIRIQDPGKGGDQVGASCAGDPRHQHMAAGTHIEMSPASEAFN